MKHLLIIAAVAACHPSPRPVVSPEQRVRASLARWGAAIEADDANAFANARDGEGQFAIAYAATKVAASHVEGGAVAVELTLASMILEDLRGAPAPGTWPVFVPTGAAGPVLAAAGVVPPAAPGQPNLVAVPVSTELTLGGLRAHAVAQRRALREQRAWTCRLVTIERTISPRERMFQRAAATSTFIFQGWLEGVEAIWLVRADCATGPAVFAITARKDGADRVLLAKLLDAPTVM